MGFADLAKQEKILKGEAISDDSLSVDQLVEELVRIGTTDGFISETLGGKFNAEMRHSRAIEIGKVLHGHGKLELMLKAFKLVRGKVGEKKSSDLRFAWQGIGGQWDPYYVANLI